MVSCAVVFGPDLGRFMFCARLSAAFATQLFQDTLLGLLLCVLCV